MSPMNLLSALATLYVAGALATYVFLMHQAPNEGTPGTPSRRVMAFRVATVSLLWPFTLLVGALMLVSPSLREWIETGRIGGDR